MLPDLVENERTIELQGGTFRLKGLSLSDVGQVLREHRDELSKLFEGKINADTLFTIAPNLCAKLIALSADDPENWDKVLSYPAGTQMKVLSVVFELSDITQGSVKKLLAGIANEAKEDNQKQPVT